MFFVLRPANIESRCQSGAKLNFFNIGQNGPKGLSALINLRATAGGFENRPTGDGEPIRILK